MNLTKEEIKFIDNYLIKNEVKFWDVRLELLDHIVSAVEDKITNDGISFNEALLEVHRGFGNQFVEFGIPKNKLFTSGLYQSNIGFEKFLKKKRKEIGRKQRKRYWKTFLPFIFSIRFLLETLVLFFITFLGYQYSIKAGLFVLGFSIVVVEILKLFYGGFKKFQKKSLNMQLATASTLLTMQLPFQSIVFFNWYFENAEYKPTYLLFILCALTFVISRHSLNNYINTYKTYKERFTLLMS